MRMNGGAEIDLRGRDHLEEVDLTAGECLHLAGPAVIAAAGERP